MFFLGRFSWNAVTKIRTHSHTHRDNRLVCFHLSNQVDFQFLSLSLSYLQSVRRSVIFRGSSMPHAAHTSVSSYRRAIFWAGFLHTIRFGLCSPIKWVWMAPELRNKRLQWWVGERMPECEHIKYDENGTADVFGHPYVVCGLWHCKTWRTHMRTGRSLVQQVYDSTSNLLPATISIDHRPMTTMFNMTISPNTGFYAAFQAHSKKWIFWIDFWMWVCYRGIEEERSRAHAGSGIHLIRTRIML